MSESLKLYCWTFFLSFFHHQYTAVNSRGVVGHRNVFPSLIDPQISPTPPLIFTGGQKVRNLASFSRSFNFEPSAFENAARYLNSETNCISSADRPTPSMSSPSLVKLDPRTPESRSVKVPHPSNIARRKRAKSSITQPSITRFRSNYVLLTRDTRSAVKVQVNKRWKVKVTAWQRISIKTL